MKTVTISQGLASVEGMEFREEDQVRIYELLWAVGASATGKGDGSKNLVIVDGTYEVDLPDYKKVEQYREVKNVSPYDRWIDCRLESSSDNEPGYEYRTVLRFAQKEESRMPYMEYDRADCGDCGQEMTLVRPDKYQCDNPKCSRNVSPAPVEERHIRSELMKLTKEDLIEELFKAHKQCDSTYESGQRAYKALNYLMEYDMTKHLWEKRKQEAGVMIYGVNPENIPPVEEKTPKRCSTHCDWPDCTLPGCVTKGFPNPYKAAILAELKRSNIRPGGGLLSYNNILSLLERVDNELVSPVAKESDTKAMMLKSKLFEPVEITDTQRSAFIRFMETNFSTAPDHIYEKFNKAFLTPKTPEREHFFSLHANDHLISPPVDPKMFTPNEEDRDKLVKFLQWVDEGYGFEKEGVSEKIVDEYFGSKTP